MIGLSVYTTLPVVLQSTIDLDKSYGPNEIQIGIALAVAIGSIVVSSLYVRFHSSLILDELESDHAGAITTALRRRERNELRIPYDPDVDVDAYRESIRELFTGDFESDVPTLPDALSRVHGEWKSRRQAATSAVSDELPALSRALSADAVLYLVAGVIVHESVSTWSSLLSTSSSPPDFGAVLEQVAAGVSNGVSVLTELAAGFPFAGVIWTFSFIGVLEIGSFVYENVFVVFSILMVGSILVWIGDRAVANDVDRKLYRTKPRAAIGVLLVFVSTWGTGVVVAVGARALHSATGAAVTAVLVAVASIAVAYVVVKPTSVSAYTEVVTWNARKTDPETESKPFPTRRVVKAVGLVAVATVATIGITGSAVVLDAGTWGAVAGLLASIPVLTLTTHREIKSVLGRLTAAYGQADDDGVGPTGTVAYLAARKVFGVVGVLAGAVLPLFVLEAVSSGKLLSILSIVATESSTQVKVTFAFVALVGLAFVVVQTRPAWGDLSDALRYSLDRKGLRIALLTRGFPALVFILSFPMFLGFGMLGPLESAALALAVSLAVKATLWLKTRAEVAYYEAEDEPVKPGRVFVDAVVVDDAMGREIAVAETNGSAIAAPLEPVEDPDETPLPAGGLDELVDQVIADTREIFENVEREPSVYEYYYERLHDGKVDFRDVRREYVGMIAKTIEAEVEKHGREGIELERLEEKIGEQYDDDLYEWKLRQERKKSDGVVVYDGRVKPT